MSAWNLNAIFPDATYGGIPGFGGYPQMIAGITDFRDDKELLAQWGVIHRREFRWSPSWGNTYVVYSAKHPTAAAADTEARRLALDNGYRPPKWWHFWRVGETPLP